LRKTKIAKRIDEGKAWRAEHSTSREQTWDRLKAAGL
jgi:hypothetical protein